MNDKLAKISRTLFKKRKVILYFSMRIQISSRRSETKAFFFNLYNREGRDDCWTELLKIHEKCESIE